MGIRERRKGRLQRRMTVNPIQPIEPQHDMADDFHVLQDTVQEFAQQPQEESAYSSKKLQPLNDEDIKDLINDPSPPGLYPIEVNGKVIDLNMLEKYVIATIPQKSLSTILRYHNARRIEELKGYKEDKWYKKRRK